ncbi:hypothetical protein HRQ91_03415 [Treponema parvum]|uniref:Ig-like domain-containing protein n=1 Tax=Treponema parvum TaxID=138851 RepID=A0A975F386_9SPIR|nr:Ig-like domain-containing protein [Treponema parvum]QTQ13582.1 hypothetical protein HRQ91_03415 [Treponema parvum]
MKKLFHTPPLNFFVLAAAALIFFLAIPSCDLGLGDSVDTETPTVSISYPPHGAIIKDSFTLAGACSDDEGVTSISIAVTNTNTHVSYGTYWASISGNSWSANLNARVPAGGYNGWTLPDGNYVFSVTAKDAAGRTSGTSSVALTIDNTPPVFVISSPGVDGTNASSDPTEYGTRFKVSGQIAEDHAVNMTVSVYDTSTDPNNLSPATLLGTYTESNIDISGGTDIVFAKYSAGGTSELNARYAAWYGGASGNKKLYAVISLADSAREYKNPSSGATGNGNSNEGKLYLYDKVYSELMSTSGTGLGLTISDIKQIYNETSTLPESVQTSAKAILTNPSYITNVTKFSINPDASPKYSVIGYGFTAADVGTATFTNSASGGQKVSVSAISGRDGTLVKPETLKAWQFGPYKDSADPGTERVLTPAVLQTIYDDPDAYAADPANAAVKLQLADNSAYTGSSVDSYSWEVQIGSTITAGKYYVIAVSGNDADNTPMTNADDRYYGFKASVSGTPPAITWDNTLPSTFINSADDLGYFNSSDMTFSGKATGGGGINSVQYSVQVTDEQTNLTVGTITGNAIYNSLDNKWTFDLVHGAGYFTCETTSLTNSGRQYLFNVTVTVTGVNGQISTRNRRIHVDTKKPDITISSVSPIVASGTDSLVNGKLTISGSVTESALKNIYYEIFSPASAAAPSYTSSDLGAKYSFSETIRTTDPVYHIQDNTSVKIVYYAKDHAGNVNSYSTTQYLNNGNDSGTPLEVKQSSDKPVVTGSNFYDVALANISATVHQVGNTYYGNLFGVTSNNKLLGTISDDDAVAKVSIGYRTANSSDPFTETTLLTGGNSSTYPFSYSLPSTEGEYEIQFTVLDRTGFAAESNAQPVPSTNITKKNFFVAVDKGSPTLVINNTSGSYYKTGQIFKVTGTASDKTAVTLSGKSNHGSPDTPTNPAFDTPAPPVPEKPWTDTITAAGTEGQTVTLTYSAKDKYGQETSSSINYTIDNTAPAIKNDATHKAEVNSTDYDSLGATWYNSTALKITDYFEENGSGISAVYYNLNNSINTTLNPDGTLTADGFVNPASAKGEFCAFSATISGFAEGSNILYIAATDNAGNVSAVKTYTINIDTTAPTIESSSTSVILTNGKADISITGFTTDPKPSPSIQASGVTAVSVYIGNTTNKIASDNPSATPSYGSLVLGAPDSDGKRAWTLTIDAADGSGNANAWFSSLGSESGVYALVTDSAGNKIDNIKIASLSVDTTAPTVSFTVPAENARVNKTISVSGTSYDNKELSSVALSYTTSTAVSPPESDWHLLQTFSATDGYNWSYNFNTTDPAHGIADNSVVRLRALATDSAGNTKQEIRSINIDQSSDRPVVSFTNLTLTGMTSSNYVWLIGSNVLRGTVSDDDGVNSIKLIISASIPTDTDWNNETALTLGNGNSWTYTFTSNGSQKVYFQVTDSAGEKFTSQASYSVDAIYLSDDTNTFGTVSHADSVLYLRVDTSAPSAAMTGISTDGLAITNAGKTWTTSYSSVLLGGDKPSFQIKLTANDENGIAHVKAKTSGLTADNGTPVAVANYTAKAMTAANTEAGPSDTIDYYLFENIACSNGSGSMVLTVTVTDSSGHATNITQNLAVDNTAPKIIVQSPSQNTTISGAVSVYGSVDSSSTMYYAVSTNSTVSPDDDNGSTAFTWLDENNVSTSLGDISSKTVYTQINDATLSWYVYFDGDIGGGATGTHAKTLNDYLVDFGVTTTAALQDHSNPFSKIVKLYVWVKAVDSAGNKIEKAHLVQLDPQGDRPTITVDYPDADGEVLGGTVRLSGNVSDNNTVKTAWVQIVSESHIYTANGFNPAGKTFGTVSPFVLTAHDLDYLANAGYNVYKMKDFRPDEPVSSTANTQAKWNEGDTLSVGERAEDFAILANISGGTSWNLKINASDEFNPPQVMLGSSTNKIAFRVYSIDDDGKESIAVNRTAVFDSDNPVISDLYLVQSPSLGSPTVTSSREYIDNMYIKGEWYLTGKATDSDKIKTLSLKINGAAHTLISNCNVQSGSQWQLTDESGGGVNTGKAWSFKYKITSGTETVGKLVCQVTAEDNATNTHTITEDLTINYDNQAPELVNTSDVSYNISGSIRQSNNFYTFGSKVKEPAVGSVNQSGFARVAFYFMRRLTAPAEANLYDIMLSKSSTGHKINVASVTSSPTTLMSGNYIYDSGLYWKVLTVNRDADTLSVLGGVAASNNIRKGGLVKIGGYLYTINSISGTNVTINGSPLYSSPTETAYFAIASVVDNTVTESSGGTITYSSNGINGYYSAPLNDDGDHMIEGVKKSGTDWTWEANVCSKNIPDGPIELHYVVFDAAGNYSIGIVGNTAAYSGYENVNSIAHNYVNQSAFVSNNPPRIAGVRLGTDYDGSDTIGSGEWNTNHAATVVSAAYMASQTEANAQHLGTEMTIGTASVPAFTFKGYSEIKPEITGGNGNLGFKYELGPNTGTPVLSGNSSISLGTGSTDYTLNTMNVIPIQIGDLLASGTTDGARKCVISVYDSTEGTSQFTDSLYAKITMYLAVKVRDGVPPESAINPFYWNTASDNSLFGATADEKKANGHIELEGDLPTTAFNDPSGVKDRDPKASGKISVTGTASDNQRLKRLYLKVPGMETKFAAAGLTHHSVHTSYYLMAEYSVISGTWTGTDAWAAGSISGNYGFKFDVNTNTFTNSGHNVTWTFSWDTSRITNVASSDIGIGVMAEDEGTPSYTTGSGAGFSKRSIDGVTYYADTATYASSQNSAASTTQTTSTTKTPYYKIDVVPYISKMETHLDKAYNSNPSVFSRSATGAYPVRSGETITLKGFNFNGSSSTVKVGSQTISSPGGSGFDTITFTAPSKSGKLSVTVNSITSLNNENAAPTFDANMNPLLYSYNAEGNVINNKLLTDDRELRVWKFNDIVNDSAVRYPTMRVGKDTDQTLGFVYDSGADEVKMYYGGFSFRIDKSFTQWYDTACAVDNYGRIYGSALNADSGGGSGANQAYYGSGYANNGFYAWNTKNVPGRIYANGSYANPGVGTGSSRHAYSSGKKKVCIENTYNGSVFNASRVMNPKISADYYSSTGHVYMTYYDSTTDQVKFRYGEVSGNPNDQNAQLSFTGALANHNNTNFGSGQGYHVVAGFGATGTYNIGTVSTDNTARAGEYSAVGVSNTTENGLTSGTAIVAWYDSSSQSLLMSHNTSPDTATSQSQWGSNTILVDSDFSGWYVDMAVDAKGGIHIAYYGASAGDLKYAYLSDYRDTTPEVVKVDSYLSVGTNISIDVMEKDIGGTTYYVPYISYFISAFTKTSFSVRTAWLSKLGESSVPTGVTNDFFTGSWEVMTVPTSEIPLDYSVGIGIKKNTSNVNSALLGYGTKKGLQTASLE